MEIKFLEHKNGGKITELREVKHETHKKVADWFYVGTVKWNDGGTTLNCEISPAQVCYDHDNYDARNEYMNVHQQLNNYLVEVGEWHDARRASGGRVVHWTPTHPSGSRALV